MKEKIRGLLSGQIPVAAIFAILGVCLIFVPATTFNVISKVVFGLALIASGLYHIFIYTFPKKGAVPSALDLYPGVISLLLGIFLFTNPQLVRVLLPWALGAFLVADSIWMAKAVMQMRKHSVQMWEIMAIVAAVFAILGIILAFNPFSQIRTMLSFAGWLLLLKAIADIVLYLRVRKDLDAIQEAQAATRTVKMADTYEVAPVEPQRPSAPSKMQEWSQKQKEKKAQRAAAREAARQQEEAERAERIRRAQAEQAEDELQAARMAAQANAANPPIDGTYTAETFDAAADDQAIEVDYTESDADLDADEDGVE